MALDVAAQIGNRAAETNMIINDQIILPGLYRAVKQRLSGKPLGCGCACVSDDVGLHKALRHLEPEAVSKQPGKCIRDFV